MSFSSSSFGDEDNLRLLRDKNDILEDELGTLKAEQLAWDVERRRLERELEVKDDALKDLSKDLSVIKVAKAEAIMRYDQALEYNKKVKEKLEELRRGFDEARGKLLGKSSALKEKLMESDKEMEDLRNRNKVLVEERVEFDALKEELGLKLDGKERQIDDLIKNYDALIAELKESYNMKARNEVLVKEMARLEAALREKDERIEELIKRYEDLETEKDENMNELSNSFEVLGKEKEDLGREKREIMAKYKMAEEKYLKLEGDVVTHLCLKANRDDKFGSSLIGKIVSAIMNALDVEQQLGVTVKEEVVKIGGNLDQDPALESHVNDMKCSSVTKSEDAARTAVISKEELSGENGAAGNQKSQPPAYIQISDSDDDEISCHVSGLKRARASSACSIQKHSDCSSSDPKRKIKKLEHLFGEPIASSDCRSDQNFFTHNKKSVPAIMECKEILSRRLKTPGWESNDGKVVPRTNKINVVDYVAKCQLKREKKVVDSVGDMVMACEKDPEFCAKAVCALKRKGLLFSSQRGFDNRDIERGTALAEYLVDGDPNYDKKKLADELKQRDPGGLDTCKKLALRYSDELFEIFKSDEDPRFSQSSTDMQYR